MQNPETHTCHKCGFTWNHDRNGSHNCSDLVSVTIKQLEAELALITHAAKELHGAISEYRGMPCESLEKRMFNTASRYKNRIFGELPNEPK